MIMGESARILDLAICGSEASMILLSMLVFGGVALFLGSLIDD